MAAAPKRHRGLAVRSMAVLAAAAIALSACAQDDTNTGGGEEVQGGTLTVAVGSLPADLDAMMYGSGVNLFVKDLLFSTLTHINHLEDTTFVEPRVVTSWEHVDDLTWHLDIIEGKEFSNGEKVNAESVKWSIEYLLDVNNAKVMRSRITSFTEVNVLDEYKLEIKTSYPNVELPSQLSVVLSLPPQDVQARGAEFWADPIGTGSYKVAEFSPNNVLRVVKNEYALVEGILDEINFDVIPEAGARLAALRAGDVDIVNRLGTDQIATAESAGAKVVSKISVGQYQLTAIQETGPLSDVRVRQAISYAIDRESLNTNINAGLGAPANQLFAPGHPGYCTDLPAYEYNPQKAKDLLAEAGYNGEEIPLMFSQGWIANDAIIGEAVHGMLTEVGINADLQIVEFAQFLAAYRDYSLRPGLFAPQKQNLPTLDPVLLLEHNTSAYTAHETSYKNPEYDALYEQARLATDAAEKQQIVCEASKILYEDLPQIPMLHFPDVWAVSANIATFPLEGSGVPIFEKIAFSSGN